MTEKIKYAIIGAGCMGQEHILNIGIIDDAEVVALCDTSEQSIKESLELLNNEVAIFNDYNDLIESNIANAFIIATPNFTHINVLKDVMKSGVHLLIEKPLCTTVKDCQEFEKLAENYPGVIWTAMEYRYMPPVQRMIKEIHNNTIGDLKMLSIREHRFPFLHKVDDWNRFAIKTGGTLVEKCCHFFDLMTQVIPSKPTRVIASGGQDVNHLNESYGGETPDILDNAYVIVEFANGARALLDLCMFAEGSRHEQHIAVTGDIGKIETTVPGDELIISNRASNDFQTIKIEPDSRVKEQGLHHGASYLEHLGFIEAINNGAPPAVTVRDGLLSVVMGAAAQQSIESGQAVNLNDLL